MARKIFQVNKIIFHLPPQRKTPEICGPFWDRFPQSENLLHHHRWTIHHSDIRVVPGFSLSKDGDFWAKHVTKSPRITTSISGPGKHSRHHMYVYINYMYISYITAIKNQQFSIQRFYIIQSEPPTIYLFSLHVWSSRYRWFPSSISKPETLGPSELVKVSTSESRSRSTLRPRSYLPSPENLKKRWVIRSHLREEIPPAIYGKMPQIKQRYIIL